MSRPLPASPDKALPLLVERYSPRLLALARRLCRTPADAEDAVQETFLLAFRKWASFRGAADPGTWLYTICVRVCRRRGKASSRRRAVSLDRGLPATGPLADPASLDRGGALGREARREAIAAVERAIAELPFEFRVPLVMKDILELPVADVSAALAIKPQTVKTRVHRARLLLRGALDRTLPTRPVPAPIYEKQVCMDLLAAKQAALDRGGEFPVGRDVLCERCRVVFAGMDLAKDACSQLAAGDVPPALKRALAEHLGQNPASPRRAGAGPARRNSGNRTPRR